MKLGDFFVELGIKTDKKSVKAIDEQIKALKELEEQINNEIKKEKELAEAQTEEQKARIKKKYEIKEEVKSLEKQNAQHKASITNFKGMIKGVVGFAGALSVAIGVMDRMINRLAMANQKMINFQRQTGISFSTLNKYASANVTANPLTSIESTAGSLQNLAQNMWDIQMGRGDVSAFQELSYFSGQNVTPYGKSIEEVIESVRSALTKIPNDVQATNLIQRMGFSADDLQMLRMTREEFEQVQNLFLSASQRKELEGYGKQLNLIHLRLKLVADTLVLKIAPLFIKIFKPIAEITGSIFEDIGGLFDFLNKYPDIIKGIAGALMGLMVILAPIQTLVVGILLLLDDLYHYYAGDKNSLIGALLGSEKVPESIRKTQKPLLDSLKDPDTAKKNVETISKLLNPLTFFKTEGAIFTELIKRSLPQNISNNTHTDNRTNKITINTQSLNGMLPFITAVTGQNFARG